MASESKIVVASGYMDPIHIGHIEYLEKAKSLGTKLIVIVNNDTQSKLKKGFSFMTCEERMAIIKQLRCVDEVIESIDTDRTVCKTLELLKPDIFAKGGDQNIGTIPEATICTALNIKIVDGLGDKVQSSRWLLKKVKDQLNAASEKYLNETL
jgi:D-beta-D-heptose 7-phosphate kinase/D-beta-D-heptose 1-phosphate adenosyltransferase